MFIDNNRVTRSDVNQRILAACVYHKQSNEDDWINDLKKNCLAQKHQQTTALLKSDCHRLQQTINSTIDLIMDALGQYTVLFNQDTDFELYLAATAPSYSTECDEKGKARGTYAGRISSRSWSLVVSSKDDGIEFLLVHSTQLLHLSRIDNLVEPICTLKAHVKDHVVFWQLRDEILHTAELARIYQETFKILIETIYQDMNDIIEKRSLEKREPERRQEDRRKTPALWQGLTSPLVERRKTDRRTELQSKKSKDDRRNRVAKNNTADAQAHRATAPDLDEIIHQAEPMGKIDSLANAVEIVLATETLLSNEKNLDLVEEGGREWLGPTPDTGSSVPCSATQEQFDHPIPAQSDAPLTFEAQWQVYSEEGWKPLPADEANSEHMTLTAFDMALLRLLQSEGEHLDESDYSDKIPSLEISSSKTTSLNAILTQCEKEETEAEYHALLEQDLDDWVREILAIDSAENSTDGTEPVINNPSSLALEQEKRALTTGEEDELASGSDQQDFLQFLNKLAITCEAPANASKLQLQQIFGEVKMGTKLTTIISQSLSRLLEDEEKALKLVIAKGTEAFSEKSFDQVSEHLKEAVLRRRVLDMINGLHLQWDELAELEDIIGDVQVESVSQSDIDFVNSYCATDCLRAGTELLMKLLLNSGAQSFQTMDFEHVHKVCKHSANLQRFQKRIAEIFGAGQCSPKTNEAKEEELIAA